MDLDFLKDPSRVIFVHSGIFETVFFTVSDKNSEMFSQVMYDKEGIKILRGKTLNGNV